MKHAGDAALDLVDSMLVELRRFDSLRERKRGVFYRKSSALIHFHEDPTGIFADLRTGSGWIRLPVNTASERRQLLRLVRETLALP
jgi:hypothetical protein